MAQQAGGAEGHEADRKAEDRRARIIAVVNQKGGVGKTTTAVSLAAALAELGDRVLLLDLDPQANATSGLGVSPVDGDPTVADLLAVDDGDGLAVPDEATIEDAITPTAFRGLHVVPATGELADVQLQLGGVMAREQRLREPLELLREDFDVILLDCPPSLGLLTVNALVACDGVLVPIQAEYYALEGVRDLEALIAQVRRSRLNPDLEVEGVLLTMVDQRTRLSREVTETVAGHFGSAVFSTRIPRTVPLAEAPSHGQPITTYRSGSRGATAYRRLAAELQERLAEVA